MGEDLKIEYRDPAGLVPYGKNARTHSAEQVRQIRRSIDEFGFVNPILLRDDEQSIGAGHGRQLAAMLPPAMTRVPTVVINGLTDEQWKALIIADNRLAENSGWDENLLRLELGDLKSSGFDLSLIGFSSLELSGLFSVPENPVDVDDVPDIPPVPVSILGDIWNLGPHRIMCGDSLDIDQVRKLLNGVTPELANCDPPYGISAVKAGKSGGGNAPYGGWKDGDRRKGAAKRGHVHGPSKNAIIKPGIYDEIIGDETTDTAVAAYHLLTNLGVPVIALWGGNYFANHLPPSRCWLIWDKETNGNFADAELAWTNQDKVAKLLRHQWSGLIKASERGQKRVHPTQKPVALAEWVADTIAPKATTVLDLFLGSGSVLIAAQNRGLTAFGMEMAPSYIDCAIARWEAFTGLLASHAETSETFAQVKERRHAGNEANTGEVL